MGNESERRMRLWEDERSRTRETSIVTGCVGERVNMTLMFAASRETGDCEMISSAYAFGKC